MMLERLAPRGVGWVLVSIGITAAIAVLASSPASHGCRCNSGARSFVAFGTQSAAALGSFRSRRTRSR
jgi:hypothetical protein